MAEIPKLNELKGTDRVLTSIGNKLESIAAATGKWSQGIVDAGDKADDLANKLDRQLKIDIKTEKGQAAIRALSGEIEELAKKTKDITSNGLKKMGEGFDSLGKKALSLQTGLVGIGINALIESIQKVYDLQERWTQVTGKMNMQMGKLAPNMAAFKKSASQAEGAIRGLTDVMGEGTQMFGDFALAYGKMDTKKSGVFVAELARGFDLGGEAAGKLSRMLDNVSEQVGAKAQHEQAEYFKTITLQADKAGIPLNQFAKDLAENSNLMSQFGKIGAKTFVQSAAYLKKFNIGLKEMDQFMSKFDTFDDAASSIAKLNTAFGTSINSLNMMMEQNPAKRFETIRGALMQQGKTFNTLTRNEIQLLKQQTGLDEQALSAMLDKKNAGVSYEKFLSEKDRKEKSRQKAEDLMKKQLQATATTMFAFGQAMDKITVAIGNAIKPFLELLGLAKKGDGPFTSFGQTMKTITDRIAEFFNGLAKNKDWMAFMQKAADVVKKVAAAIADFFSPGKLDKNIETLVKWFKRFEIASAALLGVWAVFKVGKVIKGVVDLGSAFSKLKGAQKLGEDAMGVLSKTGQATGGEAIPGPGGADVPGPNSSFYNKGGGMGSKAMGMAGKAVVGAGIGYGAGKVASMGVEALGGAKESTAGNVGAAALGGIGMLIAGPLGAALGGVIGQTFGDLGSFLYDEFKTVSVSERELTSATAALEEAQKKTAKATQLAGDAEDMARATKQLSEAKWKKDNRAILEITKESQKTGKKGQALGVDLNDLNMDQKQSLKDRLDQLNAFGLATDDTTSAFVGLQVGGKLTKKELEGITSQSEKLQGIMDQLNKELEQEISNIKAKEAADNSFQKMRQDRLIMADEQDIQRKKDANERAQKSTITLDDKDVDSARKRDASLEKQFQELADAFGDEAAKGILRDKLSDKATKDMREKAKSDMEMAQAKKLQDQKKSEDIETKHQDNLYKIALQNQIMQGDEYKAFRASAAGSKLDPSKAFGGFMQSKGATGDISGADMEKFLPHAAEGGVFKKKQTIVVAESGPEAVIPLKAFSGGMDLGAGVSGAAVNYAGGSRGKGGGEGTTKIVAGDVYLDSKLVGRHLVRSILNDARE